MYNCASGACDLLFDGMILPLTEDGTMTYSICDISQLIHHCSSYIFKEFQKFLSFACTKSWFQLFALHKGATGTKIKEGESKGYIHMKRTCVEIHRY